MNLNNIAGSLYDGSAAAAAATEHTPASVGLYSADAQPGGNPLNDGSVHSGLRGTLQDLVDAGHVEAGDALTLGRTISAEAGAVGLCGAELDVALRDLNRPIDPKTSQRQRGEAVAALRREYGDRGEEVLAAGLKVLRSKAPTFAAALARSAAGDDPALVRHVARLGAQALGRA